MSYQSLCRDLAHAGLLRLSSPSPAGYIYNGAEYCQEHGERIIRALLADPASPLREWSDDDINDSLQWPQPVFGWEESAGNLSCDTCTREAVRKISSPSLRSRTIIRLSKEE